MNCIALRSITLPAMGIVIKPFASAIQDGRLTAFTGDESPVRLRDTVEKMGGLVILANLMIKLFPSSFKRGYAEEALYIPKCAGAWAGITRQRQRIRLSLLFLPLSLCPIEILQLKSYFFLQHFPR